ncbi:hypothetical protein L596_025836 [Steinernema carpocapsae]|uniref:Beta-mannosidase-like galactose-binding domain-containing protein n=1 Tax=Steinernema carpocapsae TaxID=34508 RepID=A0A4U5M8Y3_STECR|nr:hypothetical protein L596_025836 [Steinernema carpocapsae]
MKISLLLFLLFPYVLSKTIRVDLNGSNQWMFRSGNGNSSGMATVPGDIYADLQAAGILDVDPLSGQNGVKLKWIGRTNWVYERKFNVDQAMFSKNVVLLVIRGLDTVCNVYINDEFVLANENQFHEHVINVRRYLQLGNNKLVVDFTAPVGYAYQKARTYEVSLEKNQT